MALFLGKASDGIYRMTIPQGDWEKLAGVEGINPGNVHRNVCEPYARRSTGGHEPDRCGPGLFTALAAVIRLLQRGPLRIHLSMDG